MDIHGSGKWWDFFPGGVLIISMSGKIYGMNDRFSKFISITEELPQSIESVNFPEKIKFLHALRKVEYDGNSDFFMLGTIEHGSIYLDISIYHKGTDDTVLIVREINKSNYADSDMQRWELAVSENSDGLWDYDLNTGVLYYSSEYISMLGFSKSEFPYVPQTWELLIHPDDHDRVIDSVRQHLRGESQKYEIEYRLRCKDGSYKWIFARGKVVARNQDGSPARFLGTHIDVTEKKKTEQELKNRSALLQRIIDNLPVGVHIFDRDGTSFMMNRANHQIIGMSDYETWRGRFNVFTSELAVLTDTRPLYEAARISRKTVSKETVMKIVEGHNLESVTQNYSRMYNQDSVSYRLIHVDRRITPLIGDNDSIEAYIAVNHDITDLKLIEISLKEKDELLKKTGKAAKIASWEYDLANKILKASDEFYTIMDIPAGSKLGEAEFKTFCRDETLEKIIRFAGIESYSDSTFLTEQEVKTPVGNQKWLLIETGLPEKNKLYGIIQDISSRKRLETELDKSRELMKTLFDSMDIGYMTLDDKWNLTYANRRVREVLTDITDFLNRNIWDAFPAAMNTFIYENLRTAKEGGEQIHFETNKIFGGEWYEISAYPMENGGLGVFARNVTERKRMEAEIRTANLSLQSMNVSLTRKNSMLEEFANITSHNLRAPIANLGALIQMYNITGSMSEKEMYIQLMQEVLDQVNNTLNELIGIVHIKNETDLERKRLSFEEVFRRVKDSLFSQIESSGIKIIHTFENAKEIDYPQIYLESIMQNLLSNAIKYRSPDIRAEVNISTDTNENGEIVMKVSDNGIGIDIKKYGAKLFGYRKTFHRNKDANGMGLFIVKSQIESMGGTITADSIPELGTTFTIIF
jgi:PAS domain S-box-containing protein